MTTIMPNLDWTTVNASSNASDNDCLLDGGLTSVTAYRVVALVTSSLSLLGTVFIVASFALFRHLRQSQGFRLIFYLALSNFVSAVQGIVQATNKHMRCENEACLVGAWLSMFGNLSGILWVGFIGLNFFIAISGLNQTASAAKFNRWKERVFHALAWGLPGLFTIIAGSASVFGLAGMWCWIKPEFTVARVIFYDLWLVATFLWSAFLLVWLCMKRRLMKEVPGVVRRLVYYVVVFIICNIFTVIGAFSSYYDASRGADWLRISIALFEPLHGFLNALVYGLNVKVGRTMVWHASVGAGLALLLTPCAVLH
jgi:hypothetical protein